MVNKLILLFIFILSFSVYTQNFVPKVACVGNSITEGFGRDNASSWPNQLDTLLGDQYHVRNFGIGGRTLLKNGDFPYWDETVFEMALEFEPDIVIILLGTNDSKPQNWVYRDEFYSDYVDMVNTFRSLDSKPEIFAGFPPPVFQDGFGITNQIIRDEIIPLIDSVRTTLKTFHINFYDKMLDMGSMFPDGIHLDADGYREMSKIAAEATLNRPSGVIKYFYADHYTVEEGESATLYWDTSDSSEVTLDGQPVETKGSLTISPVETTEYTLVASGEFSDTSRVTIGFLASGLIKSFYADPPVLEQDTGDSTILYWETTSNSQVWLDGNPVNQIDSLLTKPGESVTYQLITEGALKDTAEITVAVLPADAINRALLADTYSASSTEFKYSLTSAFDNDSTTFWLSAGHLTEWISADLGRELYLKRIKINWGDVFASSYRIEVLDAANKLSVFYSTASGDGFVDDITNDAIKGKQVRLLCVKSSSTTQGYAIKELEIYGSAKAGQTTVEKIHYLPQSFSLMQNNPNPFNPVTTIHYTLPKISEVQLDVFDIRGLKITTLVDQVQPAGEYAVRFDGSEFSSGIYFYRLKADTFENTKRMLILR